MDHWSHLILKLMLMQVNFKIVFYFSKLFLKIFLFCSNLVAPPDQCVFWQQLFGDAPPSDTDLFACNTCAAEESQAQVKSFNKILFCYWLNLFFYPHYYHHFHKFISILLPFAGRSVAIRRVHGLSHQLSLGARRAVGAASQRLVAAEHVRLSTLCEESV